MTKYILLLSEPWLLARKIDKESEIQFNREREKTDQIYLQ
jgi:hypothetical protein